MSKRPGQSVAAAIFLFACFSMLAATPAAEKDPLNLLLITIDTLRPDRLSCYGSPYLKTPAIDELSQRGILFTRAFAHNPITLASHANILLGLTPMAHGVHDNANFIVRKEFTTLAEWLKKAGYATAAFIGAFPLDRRFGLAPGFDVYDDYYGTQDPELEVFVERKAGVVVDKTMEWLNGRTGPWFVWVHLFDPHQPYNPPEPFLTQFGDDLYSGEVANVDHSLAKLFAWLKAAGLESRTCFILTGDHGEALGEHGETTHGYFAYNSTLWVPLIITYPGAKARQVTANASHIDIFPTACDILGLKKPSFLQGVSLMPLLQGKTIPDRKIYFEALTAYCNRGWAPLRGYILGNTKFMASPIPELYDLEKDFGELHNLAENADVSSYRSRFEKISTDLGSFNLNTARQKLDMETREKLRSLGYLASPQIQEKTEFTAKDDLKVLLPYHNKWLKATGAAQAGRLEEGIELLREIIAERKDFDLAYTYLANYLKKENKTSEAVQLLKDALDRNPLSIRIITAYGMTLVEEGRPDEAITVLKRGLELIDYDPEIWNYLGVAFWNKGAFAEAREAYEKALSLDNHYAIIFNNLGSLYLSMFLKAGDQNNLAKALENFREAIRLDEKYASAYNGLGTALKIQGDSRGAVEAWKKAIALKPDFGFPLYNLGLVYLSQGNKAEALGYFLRYKEKFYGPLPDSEKSKLDSLIDKCRE